MAIQVKGIFKNPQSKLMYDSPLLELAPHMLPYGKILVDANIVNDSLQVGALAVEVNRQDLVYDDKIDDGHDRLFQSIQDYVMEWLETNVPECVYEIASPTHTKANGDEAP